MVEKLTRRYFLALTASGVATALAGSIFGSRFMESYDAQPVPNFRGEQPRLKK